jgi:uncharacterized integral membrane protein
MPDPGGQQEPARRIRRERARAVGLVVLAVLMTLFAVLNVKDVEVNWIFGKSSTPLIVVIVVSLLVGAVLIHLAGVFARRRR